MLTLFCLLKSYLLSATIISVIRDFLFHLSLIKPKLPVWYPHSLNCILFYHRIILLEPLQTQLQLGSPMMPARLLQNYGHSPKEKFQVKVVENYNHSKKIHCDPPHSQMLFFSLSQPRFFFEIGLYFEDVQYAWANVLLFKIATDNSKQLSKCFWQLSSSESFLIITTDDINR